MARYWQQEGCRGGFCGKGLRAALGQSQPVPLQVGAESTTKVSGVSGKMHVRKDRKHHRERGRGNKENKKERETVERTPRSGKQERGEEVLQVPEQRFPAACGEVTPVQIVTAVHGQNHAGADRCS